MRIETLFERDIFRPINGVVKADQLDESSVWQELDEFVVTRELEQHLGRFFSAYCEAMDQANDPVAVGKIGVWVSGFFGSGKSHFIKVLAYLLQNRTHSHDGESRKAVEFFEEKVKDPLLLGDIKRAVASHCDVILFNIDSKADSKARDAILAVFLKVLNEVEGFSPDHPHIAHMERYLQSRGKLETFQRVFLESAGKEWIQERDAYEFNQDEVLEAWMAATGQSKESAERWIEGAEEHFSLSVENLCKWVKEYLDRRGPGHRIIFLVDEVGQFIGTDTHLMLNLQTITENLGTTCQGRAWIAVTSQEDIDAVLGEMRTVRANDFSKIQGRFKTRLSLSSGNVDEVIQERLLAKRKEVVEDLRKVFDEKGDILKHQLTFTNLGMTFKQYRSSDDFVRNYPFAPYQFQLVQKIFESIRKAGATGLHLSRGERSVLDAFQWAGKTVANRSVGLLVPLYEFYPCIESFLDTAVKKTIDQAADNASLEQFDVRLLQVLFLIRHVEEVRGNVNNLVTLCLDEIDADKLALRGRVEESLQRLEKETLISRSGEHYFFLTNEERDISREIKSLSLLGGEEPKLLGELLFDDVLKGTRKHRYAANKMDFTFNRICDGHPLGQRLDGALKVQVVTPLSDDYGLCNDAKAVLESDNEGGQVIFRLGDEEALGREVRAYLKTQRYLLTKDDGTLPASTRRIHRDLADDNRARRERLTHLLGEMFTQAGCFVAGRKLEIKSGAPQPALDEALAYLITNTFSKMGYLEKLTDNPLREIQAVLRVNDIGQQTLVKLQEANAQAMNELRSYIELSTKVSRQVVLHDMIEKRYVVRPYGWPGLEVVLLAARLLALGEIKLMMDGAILPRERAYEPLTTPAKRRKVTLLKRITSDPASIQQARNLGREVFSQMGPDGEDALVAFLRGKLEAWQNGLGSAKALAETGDYPGGGEIDEGLTLIKALLQCREGYQFIQRFNERKGDLQQFAEEYHDLQNFYRHQKPTWERLRKAWERFNLNRFELQQNPKAASAHLRMEEILRAVSPYALIKEAEELISTVEAVNSMLISERKAQALQFIDAQRSNLQSDLGQAEADEALRSACLDPLNRLRSAVEQQESIAHISQAERDAERLADSALQKIEEQLSSGIDEEPGKPPVKPRRVVKASALVEAQYLETQQDVDGFLNRLRKQLNEAIAKGERVQIK